MGGQATGSQYLFKQDDYQNIKQYTYFQTSCYLAVANEVFNSWHTILAIRLLYSTSWKNDSIQLIITIDYFHMSVSGFPLAPDFR